MSFAFLVHPPNRLAAGLPRLWGALGRVPRPTHGGSVPTPVPPRAIGSVGLAGVTGHIVLVPFAAQHVVALPQPDARRVAAAADLAVRLGAGVVGLGGLTVPTTAAGLALADRRDVVVTNGAALTASVVHRQVATVLAGARHGRVAVVGATGSVGSAVTRLLARDRQAAELTLVGRGVPRLRALAREVAGRVPVALATDLAVAGDSDVVVLLTGSGDLRLRPSHLRRDAVVLDASQPGACGPELIAERPDARFLSGGLVHVPSLRLRGGDLGVLGLPAAHAPAGLAETMLLALDGHRPEDGHFSLGRPTLAQVDHVEGLAARFAHLGLTPAAPGVVGAPPTPDPVPSAASVPLTGPGPAGAPAVAA